MRYCVAMLSEPTTASQMIENIFDSLDATRIHKANKVFVSWKTALSKINSHGKNDAELLIAHSEVVDLKNGVLLVEADHPGWIQLLQMHSRFLIRVLKNLAPDLNIRSFAFRLKGSDASLYDVRKELHESEVKKFSARLESESKTVDKAYKTAVKENAQSESETLPLSLQKKFDELRNVDK